MDNPFTKISHAKTIIEQSGIKEEISVLDAGCRTGIVTIPHAKSVGNKGKVVALDIQAKMLSKVGVKANKLNLHNIGFLETGLG